MTITAEQAKNILKAHGQYRRASKDLKDLERETERGLYPDDARIIDAVENWLSAFESMDNAVNTLGIVT